MAFFDEIGKKITLTSQSAVKKTKDVAEVMRLNSIITEEETMRDNMYREIGKLYVQLHSDDREESFASLVETVQKSNAKISELKNQVNGIKRVRNCTNCGTEIPLNVPFCSSCGQKVEVMDIAPMYDASICSMCGKELKKGLKFCTNCGNKVENAEENLSAPFTQAPGYANNQNQGNFPPAVNEPAASQAMCKCTVCGSLQNKGMPFCTNCGSKIEPEQNNNVQQPITQEAPQPGLSLHKDNFVSSEMRRCYACGNLQNKELAFCTKCGSKMEPEQNNNTQQPPIVQDVPKPMLNLQKDEPASNNMLRCNKCGSMQNKGMLFCINCGNKMEPEQNDNTRQPSIQEKIAVQETNQNKNNDPSVEMRSCPYCGYTQESNLPFCLNCGEMIDGAQNSGVSSDNREENSKPQQTEEQKIEKPKTEKTVESTADFEVRRCPACGTVQKKDLTFCTNCGSLTEIILSSEAFPSKKEGSPKPQTEKPTIEKQKTEKQNEPEADTEVRRCPACGNIQKKDLPFCTNCGSLTEIVVNGNVNRPKQEESPKPQTEKQNNETTDDEVRRCPACRNIQEKNLAFCTNCGSITEVVKRADVDRLNEQAEALESQMSVPSSLTNNSADGYDDEDSATILMSSDNQSSGIQPYLIRRSNNERFELNKAVCKIGRDKGTNDIVIKNNKYIGHNHCHIIVHNDEFFIIDDNSKNHTFVDGIMLVPNSGMKLSHGQIIKLANEEFEFNIF